MLVEEYTHFPGRFLTLPVIMDEDGESEPLYNAFDPLASHYISLAFFELMGFHSGEVGA